MLKAISFYYNTPLKETARYRILNICESLINKGIKPYIITPGTNTELTELALKNSDLFIFTRCAYSNKIKNIFKELRKRNIISIFDIDDLIIDLEGIKHIDGYITGDEIQKKHYIALLEKHKKTFEECDYFSASTHYLAQHGEKLGKESFVIKNSINFEQFQLAQKLNQKNKQNDIFKIGYFSGSNSHRRDFGECSDAVFKILKKYDNVEFHAVGHIEINKHHNEINSRIKKVPFMNYLDMLKYLSQMDINIAPLELNPFNHSKSELKIFEAGLVNVPSIASNTSSYKKAIIEGKTGYIANNSIEWSKKLEYLIQNPSKVKELGKNAYNLCVDMFYIDNCIDSIIKKYETIIRPKNTSIKTLSPRDIYKQTCCELNLKYDDSDINNLNFVSLFYKPNKLLDNYLQEQVLKSKEVNDKIQTFSLKNNNKRIFLYGAGLYLNEILKMTAISKLNIEGIFDRSEKKWLTKLDNIPIFNPEEIEKYKPEVIIITVESSFYIKNHLNKLIADKNLKVKIIDNLFTLDY